METNRRIFLKSSALAMVGIGSSPSWLSRTLYANDARSPRKKILVAIFQRGAMDGLNVVIPHGEAAYYDLRPNLAIPRPDGTPDSAIDLDGFFGLHPSLQALKPIYDAGHLAIVHAAGSPDPTRSHFDAQDYMESGTPGAKSTSDGWLNRALKQETRRSGVRAVAIGDEMPRALRGPNDAIALASVDSFQVRNAAGAAAFEKMYEGTHDKVLNGTGRETFEAVKLMQSIQKRPYSPANGARYPEGKLGQEMMQIARLIKADIGLEIAFTDVRGWDHHVNEVGAKPAVGQLANLLAQFGQALAAFHTDLGDRMANVTVVTMSEFGRTAKENGARGTDHGHANVMFAFGGGIKGGKVYGEWPGLEREQLYEERDLDVTTDFRDVLSELVVRHLGNPRIVDVFPGYDQPKFRGLVSA
ncbi:MAG: DUF1501 domain-containing protein [Bryobacterales bacterium]|nr:DUF1501 domain-containing protein [Bryobacterales bacterium]MBV9401887.1 DUF1501 domain-containing protein [Bryobacterales bacterium]